MSRVIISAGHNAAEPGAISADLKENELTAKIAKKVASQLRAENIMTLTVPSDLVLSERIKWINKTGYSEEFGDICIEFHVNDGSKSGFEGWFSKDKSGNSKKLTECIINNVCKETKLPNNGVKNEVEHPLKSLSFLSSTKPIASLIECLYIDNPEDQKWLRDDSKLDKIAKGIVKGILVYFGIAEEVENTIPKKEDTFIQSNSSNFYPSNNFGFPNRNFVPQMNNFSSGISNLGGTTGFQQNQLSRNEKREMILKRYKQILGKIPSDADINYFINLGLNEDQMIRRIVESEDHVAQVNAAAEYLKIKPDYEKLKLENEQLKVRIRDIEELVKKQNEFILQKNKIIQSLTRQTSYSEHPTQLAQKQSDSFPVQGIGATKNFAATSGIRPEKESFFDKLLRKLNEIFD